MDRWLEKYEIAKEYYAEYHNLRVPDKFVYKNVNLGNWIGWQRQNYKANRLSEERIELLNALDMVWAVPKEKWEEYYDIACKVQEEYKTLVIPNNFTYLNCNIGKWLSHQRESYNKNKLEEEKIQKLNKIGMVWDASNNNISTSFPEQTIYFYLKKVFDDAINRYTDLGFELDIFIPSINTAIEYDGYVWHLSNKNDIKKNEKCKKHNIKLIRIREAGLQDIKDESIQILKINRGYSNLEKVIEELFKVLRITKTPKINVKKDKDEIIRNYINIYNKRWNEKFDYAKEYYQSAGNLLNIKDKKLRRWISLQKQRYSGNKNPLSEEQIKKLESIGINWNNNHEYYWDRNYLIAKKYYENNGNLDIRTTQKYENLNLGSWISGQRQKYKNNKLTKEQVQKLENIGMIWDASVDIEGIWNNYFEVAKKYYEENGNLNVPIRKRYLGVGLGPWINKMRNEKSRLSNKEIEALESIGMIWDVYKTNWSENYTELVDYYNKNGNILVPFDYTNKGVRLGEWLKRQTQNRDRLNNEQIQLLEKLGVVWERNNSKWDYMYNIAQKYYEENGNLMVNTHSMYLNEKLGIWINHQRDAYQRKDTDKANIEFTNERIKKLESIGMIWNVSDYLWNQNYEVLKRYYEKFGNADIKPNIEFENIKIGKWLENQKSSYRGYKGRKKLSKVQIKKLEELNIKW